MDLLKIYSTVSPAIEKKALFKGSLIAGIGIVLLVYSGSFIKEPELKIWGIPILIFSSFLITIGLLPYRRLTYLQKNPSELIVSEEYLQYAEKNKRQITIPLSYIQKVEYCEDPKRYGIGIWFKQNNQDEKKIALHDPSFDFEKRSKLSSREFGCDLFFPFFSRRSFSRIGFLNKKESLDA